MHQHRVGVQIRGLLEAAAFIVISAVLVASAPTSVQANWKRDCAKGIHRAKANLTVVWKNLNAKRQIIGRGQQYIYTLKDSRRCAPIWNAHIKSFREDGTFVWWSRSAVNICEAGHRMSTQNASRATGIEVIAFWRRRQWRYQHCIAAGRRIIMGMGD